jgi:hypothetical protein
MGTKHLLVIIFPSVGLDQQPLSNFSAETPILLEVQLRHEVIVLKIWGLKSTTTLNQSCVVQAGVPKRIASTFLELCITVEAQKVVYFVIRVVVEISYLRPVKGPTAVRPVPGAMEYAPRQLVRMIRRTKIHSQALHHSSSGHQIPLEHGRCTLTFRCLWSLVMWMKLLVKFRYRN